MTRNFLLKRGLFLIFLELVIINFAWTGRFPPDVIYLQVIWAIGLSMVALSLLISLSKKWLWVISFIIIFGHNLLEHVSFAHMPTLQNFWFVLYERGWIELGAIHLRTSYPILPWIGIITLGYCIGSYIFDSNKDNNHRNTALLTTGILSIALFFILRLINIYGDQKWSVKQNFLETMMSFFNLTKYPPSLLFTLFNVGVGFILLALLNKVKNKKWVKPLIIFGSVPMFFYIVHLFVLKALYALAVEIFGINHGTYFGVNNVMTEVVPLV